MPTKELFAHAHGQDSGFLDPRKENGYENVALVSSVLVSAGEEGAAKARLASSEATRGVINCILDDVWISRRRKFEKMPPSFYADKRIS